MTIALTLLACILTVLLGRWMFGRWFNHVGLYGFLWGTTLALFQSGLMYFYPLEPETWLVIGAGWAAFVTGAAFIVAARFAAGAPEESSAPTRLPEPMNASRILRAVLWILNVVLAIEAIRHAMIISHLIGGIANFGRVANILYNLRIRQEIPGLIPYLSSADLAACLLAGVYASRTGRFQPVWLIPPLLTIVDSVLNMSRGTMIIGGVLFATGYVMNERKEALKSLKHGPSKIRRFIAVALALALFVAGIDFVRSSRGIVESYGTATSALTRLNGEAFITGSVVFYATGSYGVLNQYLKQEDEQGMVGGYTFAPFWRLIAKIGFHTYVEQSQPFYLTPRASNNGTYLRELDVDYGLAGITAGPFVLGALASFYWFKPRRSQKLPHMMILGHIYVVVVMSLFLIATQWGYWLASLLFGLAAAAIIDRFPERTRTEAAPTAGSGSPSPGPGESTEPMGA